MPVVAAEESPVVASISEGPTELLETSPVEYEEGKSEAAEDDSVVSVS